MTSILLKKFFNISVPFIFAVGLFLGLTQSLKDNLLAKHSAVLNPVLSKSFVNFKTLSSANKRSYFLILSFCLIPTLWG